MEATVNELLVLKNTLATRKNEIIRLTGQCVSRRVDEVKYAETDEVRRTVNESRYDPNDLEVRNSELTTAIFNIDCAIKVANAKTVVKVDGVNVGALLAPVTPRPWTETE